MTLLPEKKKIRVFLEEALSRVQEEDQGVEAVRGIALYDTEKDALFSSLEAFAGAADAIASSELVQERFGAEEATRLALQFVYEFFERIEEPRFEETVFEALWDDFAAELEDPEWLFAAVANLEFLQSDVPEADLGDGVSVRRRSSEELSGLGFTRFALHQLFEDISGFGASAYVLLVERRVEKSPENFLIAGDGSEVSRALRALLALRLLGPGDITMGRIWLARPGRLNVGRGGTASLLYSSPRFQVGRPYVLTGPVADDAKKLVPVLQELEERNYSGAPGNLDLALRSFSSAYERGPAVRDSRVLDAITAVEAVLGTGTEISFKLSFRIANILAADDRERVEIFNSMKAFYDLRSRLVHGESLRGKHRSLLQNADALLDLVRRLLRSFITLAASPGHPYTKTWFQDELDAAHQAEDSRSALRAAMNIS